MLITCIVIAECQTVTLFRDEKNTSNDEKNTSRTPPKKRGKYVFDERNLSISSKCCIFAPMEKEKDSKDIVQSYLITTARYKFTVTEKRIMYRVIESGQDLIDGRKLRGNISVQKNLFLDREVSMSYSDVLDDTSNGRIVRKALLDLTRKLVIWGDAKRGGAFHLIESVKWDEVRGQFSFRVPREIWEAMMLQFEKGFRKYQLATAMNFSSVYSMRLYELISGQIYPLTYKVADLKVMLGIDGKYPRLYDLKKWVLNVAQKELDETADYGFKYTIKGTKNATIMFAPYPISRGDHAERERLKRQLSVRRLVPKEVLDYLKMWGFTEREIKTHAEVLREVCSKMADPMLTIAEVCAKSRAKENPKGWVINALKGKLNDLK